MITNEQTLIGLIITLLINILLVWYLSKGKNKSQLAKMFQYSITLLAFWTLGLILQIELSERLHINPIYFDYIVYIPVCFVPITVFFIGLIYANTKIVFKKKYLLLFIVPIISLLVLWTNDYHHLFYESYSIDFKTNVYGPYFNIYNTYTYILLFLGIFYLLRASIKNSGLFSTQSKLIIIGISVPIIVNLLGTQKVIEMSIYITPITFTVTILCSAIAIFKFKFLGVSPIALQKIVNQMSDSYIVIGEENKITDYNTTFLRTFNIKRESLINIDFYKLINITENSDKISEIIKKATKEAKEKNITVTFEKYLGGINKYFQIEITPIKSNGISLGTLILLKDITQHKEDMETIKNNQSMLMERERLASLGQLIGGIAHNLKTPIMSIAGATEGITDLVNEYDASIENPIVTAEDYHEIAGEMKEWLDKIRSYTEYMSDILTAVKGQAVNMSNEEEVNFTIGELFKRVDILMKHELKQAVVYLNIELHADENTSINGNVNSLVQVINNMISNAIQAYNGKTNKQIDLSARINDKMMIITVKDYGPGLPKKVEEKLFKEMITTKGQNGTGLGLYMSYSTIRAHFNGDIEVITAPEKGTEFNIILPLD